MKKLTVALVGNPNAGKSTLFNALTGSDQRVGNWPGVTVEQKIGFFGSENTTVKIVDLPGINTLFSSSTARPIDEKIAVDYLLNETPEAIINVIDVNSLERSLYLTTQLLELNIPIIIVINMMDVAKKHGLIVDHEQLEKSLGIPVVPAVSNRKMGVEQIKKMIFKLSVDSSSPSMPIIHYPPAIEAAIEEVGNLLIGKNNPRFLAQGLLEEDVVVQKTCSKNAKKIVDEKKRQLKNLFKEDVDILIADYRYQKINDIVKQAVKKIKTSNQTFTNWADRFLLNRFLAIPFFLFIMYLMFTFAINIGGALQGFFNFAGNAVFVQGVSTSLNAWHWPAWLVNLIAQGIGNGITTTITFIPVIGAMFLFLAFLEDSGYMARAAFVMDRVMCRIGLPGKAFIPMIIGFGCNVPAIMAARTLDNENDRILTSMMTPFMSCSARLAIYTVFVAAFFPRGGQNIVFLLYMTGILVAVGSGFLFRKTILKGNVSSLIMEMPQYHVPHIGGLLRHTWRRLNAFIIKAGQIIVIVSLAISALNIVSAHSNESLLEKTGQIITPVFSPMGITSQNWPATVGLVTGIMAKEVVIGTLNTLYAEADPNTPIYGQMMVKFGGPLAAFAYLLFVLLYFPCAASIAVIAQELNGRWAAFAVFWTVYVAYVIAVFFYQAATFSAHATTSLIWMGSLSLSMIVVVLMLKFIGRRK